MPKYIEEEYEESYTALQRLDNFGSYFHEDAGFFPVTTQAAKATDFMHAMGRNLADIRDVAYKAGILADIFVKMAKEILFLRDFIKDSDANHTSDNPFSLLFYTVSLAFDNLAYYAPTTLTKMVTNYINHPTSLRELAIQASIDHHVEKVTCIVLPDECKAAECRIITIINPNDHNLQENYSGNATEYAHNVLVPIYAKLTEQAMMLDKFDAGEEFRLQTLGHINAIMAATNDAVFSCLGAPKFSFIELDLDLF